MPCRAIPCHTVAWRCVAWRGSARVLACVHARVRVRACVIKCLSKCVSKCASKCVHVRVCLCACVLACLHTCTHVCALYPCTFVRLHPPARPTARKCLLARMAYHLCRRVKAKAAQQVGDILFVPDLRAHVLVCERMSHTLAMPCHASAPCDLHVHRLSLLDTCLRTCLCM